MSYMNRLAGQRHLNSNNKYCTFMEVTVDYGKSAMYNLK